MAPLKIIVLEGDETGQELLEQSVRVLDPSLLGLELELEHYDLSLEKRRETDNEIVHEAARAMREAGFGLKAATVTPEGKDDVGSPNRILREEVDGKVIVRTGRRIPGVVGPVSGVHHPISVVRMAVEDAYGAEAVARGRRGRRRRAGLPHREGHALDLPRGRRVRVPHGGADGRRDARLRRPEVDRLPRLRGDAQGGARRGRRAPLRRPVLPGPDRRDLRGPADRRDRDAAGDPGAEPRRRLPERPRAADVRLDRGRRVDPARLRRRLRGRRRDGRGPARHRAVADGQGPRQPDGDAARLRRAACSTRPARASTAPSGPRARSTRACWRPPPAASRRIDLGGHAGTTEFTDAVVEKIRTKVDIWSTLGSR